MSKDDAEKTEKNASTPAEPKPRGWFRRNWRRILLLLLVVVVVGAAALYWNFFLRVYNLEVCQSAMKSIAADKAMQETLGQPIKNVLVPSQETIPNARVEKDEIDVIWNIEGPKKKATAHLLAKRRQGRWDIVILDVTPAGGKRVSIQQTGEGEGEAKPYSPEGTKPEPKPDAKKPEAKSPDINIDLPGDAPAEGKK